MKLLFRLLLALLFVSAGWDHLKDPVAYQAIVPPPLPAAACVSLSGILLILGGLGLLLRPLPAAWLLLGVLLAVFPANLYSAITGIKFRDFPDQPWKGWVRLPVQFLLAWLVYWSSRPGTPPTRPED